MKPTPNQSNSSIHNYCESQQTSNNIHHPQNKKYSTRNQTIVLSDIQSKEYASKCLSIRDIVDNQPIINQIINGDSLEILEQLNQNPQNHSMIDLLIVDPPYNLTKNYGDSKFSKMSDEDYTQFTHNWVKSIQPLLQNNASIYVCCDYKTSLIIGNVLQKYFTIQNRITWQREKGRGAKANWKNSLEDIWFCTVSPTNYTFNLDAVKIRRKVIAPYKVDGQPKDWLQTEQGNFRDTCPSNFWDDISIPYWSMPENTEHPTQKPEKLLAKLILASSNANDIVFDPFVGSGTTAVVAKKLNRNFIGIELQKKYCAITQHRLQLANTNKTIQGYTDGIFWERNTAAQQLSKNKLGKTHEPSKNF